MSGFAIRGLIEGFYGRVWSDEKRRRVLSLVAEGGMNAYFYAPKDDPFLRQQWRSEYDGDALARFSSLLDYTKQLGLDLYYCLSPGLDIEYSSDADLAALVRKYRSLYELGVRKFGLFLDDIPDKLVSPADEAKYGSVCAAHVDLINRLSAAMPADTGLVVCPMQYHGSGAEPYITTLCRGIPAGVDVFWTGKKICSPELTTADARSFRKHTGRKPLYWDNFPVNDAEMYGEMHIGPYLNRSADLSRCARGVVSNVMEYPLCSAIPLLTICDYLADPAGYAPEASFVKAVERVTGDPYADWMPFFDHTRFSCQCDCFSQDLSDHLSDAAAAYQRGDRDGAAAEIDALVASYEACSAAMRRNRELYEELEKWVDRFDEVTGILKKAGAYLRSDDEADRQLLKQAMIRYNAGAYKLAGFGLREFTEHLIGEFTI